MLEFSEYLDVELSAHAFGTESSDLISSIVLWKYKNNNGKFPYNK